MRHENDTAKRKIKLRRQSGHWIRCIWSDATGCWHEDQMSHDHDHLSEHAMMCVLLGQEMSNLDDHKRGALRDKTK